MFVDEVKYYQATSLGLRQESRSFPLPSHPGLPLVTVVNRFVIIIDHHKLLPFIAFVSDSRGLVTAGWRSVGPSKGSHGAEVFSRCFDHVISLVHIDVDTFTMADWLEPKMMQLANCSAQ